MAVKVEINAKSEPTPNSRQQQAIDTLDGPVMLLAGPGTGKTFTLTRRIKKILEEKDVEPNQILCLTFSNTATANMKSRIIDLLGTKGAEVNVSTYHSFCNNVIAEYPSKFEFFDDVRLVDDMTCITVIKESIDELHQQKPIEFLIDKEALNRYAYVKAINTNINLVKQHQTTEAEFYELLSSHSKFGGAIEIENEKIRGYEEKIAALRADDKDYQKKLEKTKGYIESAKRRIEAAELKISKAKEFYEIYKIYVKKLHDYGLIDFSDMINLVVDALKNDTELLEDVAGNFEYILVDEYQDTSAIENELIFTIAKGANTRKIFVVGDDDQIIFPFKGARCDNLKRFVERYEDAEVICLVENNRSSSDILKLAETVIDDDLSRLTKDPVFIKKNIEKKLVAKNKDVKDKNGMIRYSVYESPLQEQSEIADEIKRLIEIEHVKPSEIAILAKKHDVLAGFAQMLRAKGIDFQVERMQDVSSIPSFIVTYFYLKALLNSVQYEDKLFGLITNEPFLISDRDYFKILELKRLSSSNETFYEIIEKNLETEFQNSNKVKEFYAVFNELRKLKTSVPLVKFLHMVISKTGILESFAKSEDESKYENIAALKRLIDEAESYVGLHNTATLQAFVEHIDDYFNQKIPMTIEKNLYESNSVKLLTYFSSKGLEFEYVFMPNLISGDWESSGGRGGGKNSLQIPVEPSKFIEDDEKENKKSTSLKILFVGITRSKFGLYLSYPAMNEKFVLLNMTSYIREKLSSIKDPKLEPVNYKLDRDIYIKELTAKLLYNDTAEVKKELRYRCNSCTANVSASALNDYSTCPLMYYYKRILKVPVSYETTPKGSFGSAVHNTVQEMVEQSRKNGKYLSRESVWEIFETKLKKIAFEDDEQRENFLARGEKALRLCYDKLTSIPLEEVVATELPLNYSFKDENGREYKINGTIDRITFETLKEDNKKHYCIYDFKTGKNKKDYVSEGGKYYDQLAFYKLLFEKNLEASNAPDKKVDKLFLLFPTELEEDKDEITSVEVSIDDAENYVKQKVVDYVKKVNNFEFPPIEKDSFGPCAWCSYGFICEMAKNEELVKREMTKEEEKLFRAQVEANSLKAAKKGS